MGSSYPLILNHFQEVEGSDHKSLIRMISSVLLYEDDGVWYFSAIQPGLIISHGSSRQEAIVNGRKSVTELFEDLCTERTYDALMADLDIISGEIDEDHKERWLAALKETKRKKHSGELPDELSSLDIVETEGLVPFAMQIERLQIEQAKSFAIDIPSAETSGTKTISGIPSSNNELKRAA